MDRYERDGRREVQTLADVRAIDAEARRFASGSVGGLQFKVL
jgi:hypothetical protein